MTPEEMLAKCEEYCNRAESAADRAEGYAKDAASSNTEAERNSETAKKYSELAGESHKNVAVLMSSKGMPPTSATPEPPKVEPKVAAAKSILGIYFEINKEDALRSYQKAKNDEERIKWAKEIIEKVKGSSNPLARNILASEKALNS